jgi:hypothetical protein
MEFNDKEFKEVPGGKFDSNGFYITPNGSFWDPDGVYFNNDGFDRHGGFYDDKLEYHPGKGWIDELMCYEDEKDDIIRSRHVGEEEHDEGHEELDDIYENVDYDKMLRDMEKRNNENNIKQFKPIVESVKIENVTEDMLFNKIPENKKKQEEVVRKEKVVEVDSLFG